jgi:hypothetical protein
MMAIRMPTFGAPWLVAALLAMACAGCSAPNVSEPAEPLKDGAPSAGKGEPVSVKEQVAAPNPQASRILTPSKSEQELERGLASYEDGEYKASARQLQLALDLGLDAKRDQAKAHKYLAFISCVTGREKKCRDEFNKALDADPKFDLEPAEAGHPIWGPVLRGVKAERAAKAKSKSKAKSK